MSSPTPPARATRKDTPQTPWGSWSVAPWPWSPQRMTSQSTCSSLGGGEWEGVRPGRARPPPSPPPLTPLTSSSLEGLELDGLDVVDKRRHFLSGIDLTAGSALWTPNAGSAVPWPPAISWKFPHLPPTTKEALTLLPALQSHCPVLPAKTPAWPRLSVLVPSALQPSLWASLMCPGPHLPGLPSISLILGGWNSSPNPRGSIIHTQMSPKFPSPVSFPTTTCHLLLGGSQEPQTQPLLPELDHGCPHPSPLWAPLKPNLMIDLFCHLLSSKLSAPSSCTAPSPCTLWPCHRAFARCSLFLRSAHPTPPLRSDSPSRPTS